jgi:hypothetical protein
MTNIHQLRQYTGGSQRGDGGSGPEDPMLERRVDTLEADMKEVKASLLRLETGFARMEERLSHVATVSDIAAVRESVSRLDGKLTLIPTTWQIIAILAALLFGVASLVYATNNFLGQKAVSAPPSLTAPIK